MFAHPEFSHECMGHLVGLLQIIIGASCHAFEEDLLRYPAAKDAAKPIKQFLP
jgi:hypothetical protein